jgi:hypothetical protein
MLQGKILMASKEKVMSIRELYKLKVLGVFSTFCRGYLI